jgi:hypothetical protein
VNLEKYLSFVTHRSESIIQWLFLAILILSGILIARALFGKKSEESAIAAIPAGGIDLQTALQKIMEQTTKLESVSLEKMNSKDVAAVDVQVQALKADLAARESEIAKLKEAGQAAPAAAGGPALDQLSARIKELESKLAEYEILEDDIADLSLYKEENARLKVEIEKAKGGAPAAAAPAEPAKPAGEAIVEEFTQAVNTPPMAEGETQVVSGEIPNTGDPMKDFEGTMSLEKKLEAVAPGVPDAPKEAPAKPAAGPEPVLSPAPSTVADTPAAAEMAAAQAEADDLFAEFSTGDEQLDTEKMMAEMAALVNMEPATGNSLEESIDTEKMAAEASTLSKA